jgi:predicted dehydrogenase
MDLGVHLVDLALWTLDFPAVTDVRATLFADGAPLRSTPEAVEDYALATLTLERGGVAQLACSWRLHAGQDAVIEVHFYGTAGAASLRNVNGSFYDFSAELCRGTTRTLLASPPDAWSGRAAVDWATRLAEGARFDAEAERLIEVAAVLDRITDNG